MNPVIADLARPVAALIVGLSVGAAMAWLGSKVSFRWILIPLVVVFVVAALIGKASALLGCLTTSLQGFIIAQPFMFAAIVAGFVIALPAGIWGEEDTDP